MKPKGKRQRKGAPGVPLTLVIDRDLRKRLGEIAAREDRSMSSIARKAIESYVREALIAPAEGAAA